MELFVVTQIAAYQRKRIIEYIFLRTCPENVYLCLQQRLPKLLSLSFSHRLFRISDRLAYSENGYDLVT